MHSNQSLVEFKPIFFNNKLELPTFDPQISLELLRRKTEKKVSFSRAYLGWRTGGSKNEFNLGSGKSFLRWLIHHQISILWEEGDFKIHPLLSGPSAPKHLPNDEFGKDHSFAIRTVMVENRSIRLYITDQHMLKLLNFKHGMPEDFLELVKRYISNRFQWERWKVPSPFFLDWMISHQKKPLFRPGHVGLNLESG